MVDQDQVGSLGWKFPRDGVDNLGKKATDDGTVLYSYKQHFSATI